jgi:hypothetical protein
MVLKMVHRPGRPSRRCWTRLDAAGRHTPVIAADPARIAMNASLRTGANYDRITP